MKSGMKLLLGSVVIGFVLALTLQTSSYADEGKGKGQGKVVELNADGEVEMIEEEEPGHPELVKVTHIFRNEKSKGKGRQQVIACSSCPLPEGDSYKLSKYKWFDTSFSYTVYTLNSGLGASAGTAVINSFKAWTNAAPAAPVANATQNDTSAGPGIGSYNDEQNVSWQPLSATYGSNTLAVTLIWATRAKIGKIVHFGMAFNTDFTWELLGSDTNCGGGGTAYDVQDVGTHEAGHVYGLGHSNDCNLTMNPTAKTDETIKSSLATGDSNGIQSLY